MHKTTILIKLFLSTLFLSAVSAKAQPGGDPLSTARQYLHNSGLDKSYTLGTNLHPDFLQSTLKDEQSSDLIVPISNKVNGKKGLVIFSGHGAHTFIIGAGKKFGDAGDDFKWAKKWSVYTKPTASKTIFNKKTGDLVGGKTVRLEHPGILILDDDSNGCIIYWDGRKYTDIHQGE